MIPHRPQFSDVALAPTQVVAFHGCHRETAHRVMRGDPFVASSNAYDWLGEGVYFWEYAPYRAWEWAQVRFGNDSAVLKAELRLGHCLNLLDIGFFQGIQTAYGIIEERYRQEEGKLPINRADKRHFLDRLIVDAFCEMWMQSGGAPYQTVRGCFPEGDPVYPGSKILRETHVQIAVRDVACLSAVQMVE